MRKPHNPVPTYPELKEGGHTSHVKRRERLGGLLGYDDREAAWVGFAGISLPLWQRSGVG